MLKVFLKALRRKDKMVEVINESLLHIQVCSDIQPGNKQKLIQAVNAQHLAGTSGGWFLSEEPERSPVKCAKKEGFWHYIMVC